MHYEHTEIGFNYRLSNLLAAIGRAQLERLPEMSARRVEINDSYREALAELDGVSFMPIADPGWNGWLTCVVFDDPAVRDRVQADARRRRHREPPAVEADAPAAGVRRSARPSSTARASSCSSGALPAERQRA